MRHPVKKNIENMPNPLIKEVFKHSKSKIKGGKIHWWAIDRYKFHCFFFFFLLNNFIVLKVHI